MYYENTEIPTVHGFRYDPAHACGFFFFFVTLEADVCRVLSVKHLIDATIKLKRLSLCLHTILAGIDNYYCTF